MTRDEFDLHSGELMPGEWWACSEPERPADDFAAFELTCRHCRTALVMVVKLWPPTRGVDVRTPEDRDGHRVLRHRILVQGPGPA